MARFGTAGALASAVLFMAPLHAQDARLSLADRVSQLEQLAQSRDQTNFKLLNQMQQMQSQMQQMQGQIEVLQHQLQEMQDTSKAQYLDLDSRVGRLEKAATATQGGQPAAASSAAGASAHPASSSSSSPAPGTPSPSASSGAASAPSRPTAAMQKAYEAAFRDVTSGHYVDASRGFRDYIEKYPVNTLTPNALYWLGESYYATTDYPVALQAFQHLLQQFPQSEKAPAALLKLGYTQQALKQQADAVATLKSVVARYPGTRVAELAKERLHQIAQSPSAH